MMDLYPYPMGNKRHFSGEQIRSIVLKGLLYHRQVGVSTGIIYSLIVLDTVYCIFT